MEFAATIVEIELAGFVESVVDPDFAAIELVEHYMQLIARLWLLLLVL